MSASEFQEWMEYFSIEPFGEERADYRAGIISSTIYNVNRGKNRVLKPEDFMPKFINEKSKKQSIKQMIRTVELLNTMFGGQDLRGVNGTREINSTPDS